VPQPIVSTVVSPAEPRQDIQVTGHDFGQVVEVFFVDPNGGTNTIRADYFQVDSGQSLHVTVPASIVFDPTNGSDYIVQLSTLENETSSNAAGLLHVVGIVGNLPTVDPTPVPTPDPLPVDGSIANLDLIRQRLRLELADRKTSFEAVVEGTGGFTTRYELPVRHIEPTTVSVRRWDTSDNSNLSLAPGNDFTMDAFEGSLTLADPLTSTQTLVVTGVRAVFFEDEVLDEFLRTAFIQLTYGRTLTTLSTAPNGYRLYAHIQFDWDTLPEIEWLPLVLMGKVQALWVLATDMAYQVDINVDGQSIPVTERYRQMMSQITADTLRIKEITQNLNIGLERIEQQTLRRVSRTTGKLVPVYVEKEYDDYSLPQRVLPGIDDDVDEGTQFTDNWYAGGGYGGGYGP
jgi:hypothetical protein